MSKTERIAMSAAKWMEVSRAHVTVSFEDHVDAVLAQQHGQRFVRALARRLGVHILAVIYADPKRQVTHLHIVVDIDLTRSMAEYCWRFERRARGFVSSGRPIANVHVSTIDDAADSSLKLHNYGARHGSVTPVFACPRVRRSCRAPRGCKFHPSRRGART